MKRLLATIERALAIGVPALAGVVVIASYPEQAKTALFFVVGVLVLAWQSEGLWAVLGSIAAVSAAFVLIVNPLSRIERVERMVEDIRLELRQLDQRCERHRDCAQCREEQKEARAAAAATG